MSLIVFACALTFCTISVPADGKAGATTFLSSQSVPADDITCSVGVPADGKAGAPPQ